MATWVRFLLLWFCFAGLAALVGAAIGSGLTMTAVGAAIGIALGLPLALLLATLTRHKPAHLTISLGTGLILLAAYLYPDPLLLTLHVVLIAVALRVFLPDAPPQLAPRTHGDPRDPDNPTCPECGYSLRGLPEPRCPECGAHFDPATDQRVTAQ